MFGFGLIYRDYPEDVRFKMPVQPPGETKQYDKFSSLDVDVFGLFQKRNYMFCVSLGANSSIMKPVAYFLDSVYSLNLIYSLLIPYN